MSANLFQTIRRIVAEELRRHRVAELANVDEVHPHAAEDDQDNYACTVTLRESGIVLARVPVATPRIGSVAIPAAGETVLVQFLGGDLNRPVITGRLYDDEQRPPVSEDGKAIWHLPLDAGEDDAVHAELVSGEERRLALKLGAGLELLLQDDDPVVELAVDGGKATLTIARDGTVSVESDGDLSLKGQELSFEGSAITFETSGDLTLNGKSVNIN